MKIAVTYGDGLIFQHFGHTPQFKIYDTENGNIIATQIIETGSSGHGALAGLLQQRQVEVLICGGIGGGAQAALAQAGIQLYGGVTGDADDAVADFLAGQLAYNPCVRCNHHGEGHSCGDHDCGSHC